MSIIANFTNFKVGDIVQLINPEKFVSPRTECSHQDLNTQYLYYNQYHNHKLVIRRIEGILVYFIDSSTTQSNSCYNFRLIKCISCITDD